MNGNVGNDVITGGFGHDMIKGWNLVMMRLYGQGGDDTIDGNEGGDDINKVAMMVMISYMEATEVMI